MSTNKPKVIPLATLVESELTEGSYRNAHVLMGEKNSDPRLRQAIMRELWESRDAERQRAAPYRKGGKRGRTVGRVDTVRDHIRALMEKHPKLTSPSQLLKKADRAIIGNMAVKTFNNHVRALRTK